MKQSKLFNVNLTEHCAVYFSLHAASCYVSFFFIFLCFKCVEMVNDNGLMVIICWILSLAATAFQFMKPWSTNHIMLGVCRITANEWYFTSLNMHIHTE